MDDTYELIRKESKYRNLKDNIINIINTLNSSDAIDNLSMAQSNLNENYLVDNVPVKNDLLNKEIERLKTSLSTLNTIAYNIDSKMKDIKNDIQKAKENE